MSRLFPTSSSIQKEYVQKRQRALYANNPAKTAALKKKVERLMAQKNRQGDWLELYHQIQARLQASDLTINFDAGSWFLEDNTYKTYAQMYQRAVGTDGKMVLQNQPNGNHAVTRSAADDLVTLPQEWAFAHPFSQRKRLYDALSATGAAKANVAPGRFGDTEVMKQYATKLQGDDAAGYTTRNKDFKPKAKQVFAALNYGRRPHGSNTTYGWSHLVLKPELKRNALYYPKDTFYLANEGTRVKAQAAFCILGAVMEYAHHGLMDCLWRSGIEGATLPDTGDGCLLIEAHLFTTIKVNRDVVSMVLSKPLKPGPNGEDRNPQWNTIVANARTWCTRNNVALNVLG